VGGREKVRERERERERERHTHRESVGGRERVRERERERERERWRRYMGGWASSSIMTDRSTDVTIKGQSKAYK